MNKNKTIKTLIILTCAILVIASLLSIVADLMDLRTLLNRVEVNRSVKIEVIDGDSKETIYVKFRAWGLAGNHEEIVISPYKDSLANPETDYIVYGSTELFLDNSQKKVVLIIPDEHIPEPKTKYTNFVIKQDADYSDLTRRYKNNQLIRIDLFDEQNSILIINKE